MEAPEVSGAGLMVELRVDLGDASPLRSVSSWPELPSAGGLTQPSRHGCGAHLTGEDTGPGEGAALLGPRSRSKPGSKNPRAV